ncbi:amidase 1 [Quercus suber]|uniref:Amidase 1 n=1 Tax=Quercus suber TaxID=58331 RepID=A0AAW0KFZ6_QUESU
MARDSDYGAFMEKFLLQPSPSLHQLPLHGLTFAFKDIFDVDGYVTGFGNPDWARTHPAATSTAPAILAVLRGGATCVGKTVTAELAYSINGENKHYGTPTNPCVPDRVPGGSSSGSAVAVGAKLVDFALGTDTGGSVRVPASYCGILGFRPSHDAISTAGVIPLVQSFDTVGWFARDPVILNRVGRVLLQLPDVDLVRPSRIIIAEDCFQLSDIPKDRVIQPLVKSVEKYEFKNNHGEWINTVKPDLGPGISERVWEALMTTDENLDICHSVKSEAHAALIDLLGDFGVLAIPTVLGPPSKLQTDPTISENFCDRTFSLLLIASASGFCQVSIPLGLYDNLPVSISLLATHGSDGFLLNLVETLYDTLKEEVGIVEKMDYGAFMEKFVLQPSPSAHELPLSGLTFAVKDLYDVDGYVTGFGNPDWARTHPAATSTAPAVSSLLRAGATCIGKTVMDEMAYSIEGENIHYGTPRNPCAPDRIPGGSSSGSAVAVAAKLT